MASKGVVRLVLALADRQDRQPVQNSREILAMGAGRVAVKSIDEYLKSGEWPEITLDA